MSDHDLSTYLSTYPKQIAQLKLSARLSILSNRNEYLLTWNHEGLDPSILTGLQVSQVYHRGWSLGYQKCP